MIKRGFVHCVALLCMVASCSSCLKMRTSDQKSIKKIAKTSNDSIYVIGYNFEEINIRAIGVGVDKNKPLLVFVHGAPGSSDAFLEYLGDTLLSSKFRMIAIDRLGYGYSDYGNAHESLDEQTRSLEPLISRYDFGQKIFFVGHSFGGPIIANYAANHSDIVSGIVMLAPAIAAEHEKIMTIAHLGRIRPFRWMAPKPLRVATDEKFSHSDELRKLKDNWTNVVCPVWHMHGDKDVVVPYENMAFVVDNFTSTTIRCSTFEKENHFIPWTKEAEIKLVLLGLLNN